LHWIQHANETPSNALWRFIPVLNPDGLLAKPARRMNANGVDLNRNFPTPQWAKEAKASSFYGEGGGVGAAGKPRIIRRMVKPASPGTCGRSCRSGSLRCS
jgi:hypothetical protein